jgi:hypothetical protein
MYVMYVSNVTYLIYLMDFPHLQIYMTGCSNLPFSTAFQDAPYHLLYLQLHGVPDYLSLMRLLPCGDRVSLTLYLSYRVSLNLYLCYRVSRTLFVYFRVYLTSLGSVFQSLL